MAKKPAKVASKKSKNDISNRGKSVVKRVFNGQEVTPIMYACTSTGQDLGGGRNIVAAKLPSGELVRNAKGQIVPYSSIG